MRRKRYDVTLQEIATGTIYHRQVLAYPTRIVRESICAELNDRDNKVISIRPTPRRRRQAAPATPGWLVDETNLARAIKDLKIKFPVRIKTTGHRGGRLGAHQLRFGYDAPRGTRIPAGTHFYHHITVKSWLSAQNAGETIWHELTHAMQAERAIRESAKENHGASLVTLKKAWENHPMRKGRRYLTRPCEVEARSYEHRNAQIPLARKANP